MPTLGEACSILRVSRRTLDKWLERLKIEPVRHPRDYRFFTISDEELQQVADARAEMPGNRPALRPTASFRGPIIPPAPARPSVGHPTHAQEASDAEGLPAGYVSLREMCKLHTGSYNLADKLSDATRKRGSHPLVTVGNWTINSGATKYALSPEQQRAFCEKYHARPEGWTDCPDCPH